jgi:Kef-type K+ transport system membrane component KefB
MPFALFASAGHGAEIPLAMLLVFGAAKLFAEIFERMGQPGIVGEIIAGILIGPSVLGWIQPNDILTALSELGVMFLLFRVGLEVKSSELMKVGPTASLVAIAGVVVPFVLGWGIFLLWGYPQIQSIFVGAAMVATSVGITAQVLAGKGLLHLAASKIILGAAVIDDILGLLVLAMVSSMARGSINFLEIGTTAVLAPTGSSRRRARGCAPAKVSSTSPSCCCLRCRCSRSTRALPRSSVRFSQAWHWQSR